MLALAAWVPAASAAPDQFTPVTVSPTTPSTTPVLGSDDRYHLVYELELTNNKLAPATIQSIAVRDAARPQRIVARFAGKRLVDRLRTMLPRPAANATIGSNQARLVYIELAFRRRSQIPGAVVHTVRLRAADNPAATKPRPLRYTVARLGILKHRRAVRLAPPLRGAGWVALNGCCNPGIVHRGSFETVNGGLFDAQRFAIDWMRIDPAGRFVAGDPGEARNYHSYGADILSVADGRVVSTLSNLPDQRPGQLPDPSTITLQTVDGNHVVIRLDDGRYVFYAHMQHGSVTVRRGQRVRRGQVLGRLGNSGNTSAPHLHLHVMNGPSVLGSEGLPFVIGEFALTGQVSREAFDAAPGIEGSFPIRRPAHPGNRGGSFPLDLNIVAFP
jgi:hypothetical protein